MRRVINIFLPIVVLATITALAPAPAGAQSSLWPSSNGLMVFRSDRDGEPDLFTTDPNGTTTKLTATPGADDLEPAWSPDGERIAFVRRTGAARRTDLFVMSSEGRGRVRLTSTALPERDPSWSPNGTMIVYAARTSANGDFHIFLAKADGSARRALTSPSARSTDRAPVFSPDGSQIAFVSDRAGGFPELYVMDAGGGMLPTGSASFAHDARSMASSISPPSSTSCVPSAASAANGAATAARPTSTRSTCRPGARRL